MKSSSTAKFSKYNKQYLAKSSVINMDICGMCCKRFSEGDRKILRQRPTGPNMAMETWPYHEECAAWEDESNTQTYYGLRQYRRFSAWVFEEPLIAGEDEISKIAPAPDNYSWQHERVAVFSNKRKVSISEYAEMMDVEEDTVKTWMQDGRIDYINNPSHGILIPLEGRNLRSNEG